MLACGAPRQGAVLAHKVPEQPRRRKNRQTEWRDAWALAATLGWSLVAGTCIGGALGYWADRSWGTRPWLTVAGFALGTIASLFQFIRAVTRPRSGS